MNILVINAGSSSLKYQLIDMDTEIAIAKGACDRIAAEGSILEQKACGKTLVIKKSIESHTVALELVLQALTDKEYGPIESIKEINAVGHRVLHSGEDFKGTVLIDENVIKTCEKNEPLGPLHMPANIDCIKSCRSVLKDIPMTAVFDTTFHSTMEPKAFLYGVPYEAYTDYQVRKYGFHGTSHKFVSGEAAKYLGCNNAKIITCHLGNGSSITAVKDGKCVDTSMGFTPLEGLIMGTRCGDIDPAVIKHLMNNMGMDINEILLYLNKESGVLGISGVSSDFRDLTKAVDEGNYRAKLAIDMFVWRARKYIGAYAAVLGGVDCIVFTGGIGENHNIIRSAIMKDFEYLGVKFDEDKNKNFVRGQICEISNGGTVKVIIVPTNEELVIARETLELI